MNRPLVPLASNDFLDVALGRKKVSDYLGRLRYTVTEPGKPRSVLVVDATSVTLTSSQPWLPNSFSFPDT